MFKDGTTYEFVRPQMCLENIMSTNKKQVYYNFLIVKDVTNGIHAEVKYNPNFDSSMKGVMSRYTVGWFKSTLGHNHKANRPARADDLDIKIIKRANKNSKADPHVLEKGDEIVAEGDGSWLSYVQIDDVVFWQITDPLPKLKPLGDMSTGEIILESDTRKRPDVVHMLTEEWEEAEARKVELEELQRKDKKMRIAAAKKKGAK